MMTLEGTVPEWKFLVAAHFIRGKEFTCYICEYYADAVDIKALHFAGAEYVGNILAGFN